jgi:mRNA-degrading endonuclease RelE of RelBE toxin-antitoxin system
VYRVEFSREAAKFVERTDDVAFRQIEKAAAILEESPLFHPQIKKLAGKLRGLYRIHAGRLRIVYAVNQKKKTVSVVAIGVRGGIYKG